MANLAQARSKALSKARASKVSETRESVLTQIFEEGFEDYDGGVCMHPYKGEEAFAYRNGWEAAHAKSSAVTI